MLDPIWALEPVSAQAVLTITFITQYGQKFGLNKGFLQVVVLMVKATVKIQTLMESYIIQDSKDALSFAVVLSIQKLEAPM